MHRQESHFRPVRAFWSLMAPLVLFAATPVLAGDGTAPGPSGADPDERGSGALFDRYLLARPASASEVFSGRSRPASLADQWGRMGDCVPRDSRCVPRPGREPAAPPEPGAPPTEPEPAPVQPQPEVTQLPGAGAQVAMAQPTYSAPNMLGDFFTSGGTQVYQLRPFIGPAIEDSLGEFHILQGGDLDTASPPAELGDRFFRNGAVVEQEPELVTGLSGFEEEDGAINALPGTFQARESEDQVLATDSLGTTTTRTVFDVYGTSDIALPAHLSQAFSMGILKFAEGGSPLPVDRLIFNYHYFDNTALFQGGVNVHRFVPGFEKTFFDGLASVEVRIPMLVTLDSEVDIQNPGATDTQHGEFGNLRVTPKVLLYQRRGLAVGAGLPILVPTADDLVLNVFDREFLRVENEAVHLAPYLGAVYAPNERFFTQGFLQFDIDANGNPVSMRFDPFGTNRFEGFGRGRFAERRIGRLNDPTFLFLDWQMGYWFKRETDPCATGLTGMAGIFEMHYSGSLDETDTVSADLPGRGPDRPTTRFGADLDNIDVLNLTVGSVFEFDYNSSLLLGYAVPLGEGADEPFDGELRVLFTHRFGQPSRLQQTVF